jgi:hypothetical protein
VVLVPRLSISHSPAPQSFKPVLSTSRCKGSAPVPDCDRGQRFCPSAQALPGRTLRRSCVVSLAGQRALTSEAGSTMLTGNRHRCRDDLRLDCGHELFRLGETKPRSARPACSSRSRRATSTSVVSPASNSATNLARHTSFGTRSPSSRELKTYRTRNKPYRIACSRRQRRTHAPRLPLSADRQRYSPMSN